MKKDILFEKLDKRAQSGNLRQLPTPGGNADFVSNDYLGLACNQELGSRILERIQREGFVGNGGTGSRLLSGNHSYYSQLEASLKLIFQAEEVLVFNSGYAANQAVVSSLATKGDTIIYDQLAHVCLKEGAWLSDATTLAFRHNDCEDLEMKLVQAKGQKFVVTETIFSMDGDLAPLKEIIELCERYEAHLIVDEAHSTGVFGPGGGGYLLEQNLHERVFVRVYTFGKGMGVHGACVAGSTTLIRYLINFGRPFIYTTSLPPHSIMAIQESFSYLGERMELQKMLKDKIGLFRKHFSGSISTTAIQPVLAGSNNQAKAWSEKLQGHGFDVRPILSPTVQRGQERLRINIHVHNTKEDIVALADLLGEFLQ